MLFFSPIVSYDRFTYIDYAFSLSFPLHPAANVCDNEVQICQNGGTCHNNVRCLCPAAYTGILCEEKRSCKLDPESCNQGSGQGAISLPLLLLLLPLVASLGLSGFFVF